MILLAGLSLVADAGRVPRTEEVEVEPEVVLPVEESEPESEAKQVRHHIYMPMPMLYRQSAQAPVIQYVPVPDSRLVDPRYVDPRFISLGAGAYANLGLISAGGNFGIDGTQGTFNAGAGAGLGQNFAYYGQQGVTSLPKSLATTTSTSPYLRTVPANPYTSYIHGTPNTPYAPATPKAVVYF